MTALRTGGKYGAGMPGAMSPGGLCFPSDARPAISYGNPHFQGHVAPTSYPQAISPILEILLQLEPKSVLDIGMGSGKYGVLCRECLDVWLGETLERRARIDGIEGHAPYVTDLHRAVYDEILIGDALELVPHLTRRYDVALLIDVFEHIERAAGARLLDAVRRVSSSVLVSVPVHYWPQGADFGNELERHRAHYTPRDLRGLGFRQVWRVYGSYLALCSARAVRLRPLLLRYALDGLPPVGLVAMWRRVFRRAPTPGPG